VEFKLNYRGLIKEEVTIKVDGLTVIVGSNDTGKSTIGKSLLLKVNSLKNSNIFPIPSSVIDLVLEEDEDISNAIFIDTPSILDIFSYIKASMMFINEHRLDINLPYYKTDLIFKLSQDKYYDKNSQKIPKLKSSSKNRLIYNKIRDLIDGEVVYDEFKGDIFFKKSSLDNRLFKMEETSSGIKMFGLLQILILNGEIREDTILILDEPEAHLHPKWQLQYSKILIKLIENGVKVLLTSHNLHMIKAIKKFSYLNDLEDLTNFYLADDGFKSFNHS